MLAVKTLLAAIALALALPATAGAGLATITSRDVPLHGERTLAGAAPRFDLVGVHWRGSGSVQLRTRSVDGRWGAWRAAAPEPEDLPDPSGGEGRSTRGWRLGNPLWTGPSSAIRYRLAGRVTALRAFFVRSPELRIPLRVPATASSPPIVPRSAWGADESIRANPPQYATSVRFSIVHHTAGPNTYTRTEAPAIMRAIQLYHVQSNGWNDIGYNFLIDRFGTVYEGRYGGITSNVVGAHAKGFNTGSVGVAMIGTFETGGLPAAAEASLDALLAWRLDLAHVDPLSTLTVTSGGSERFPAGIPVVLRAVSGHRDTGLTACPGEALYARLGAIARATQPAGLPKLYEPAVSGAVGGVIRFGGRLSEPLAWNVTVTDAAGVSVAGGAGYGQAIDWKWDSTGVVTGGLRWSITAGADVTPATGPLGPPASGGGPTGGGGTTGGGAVGGALAITGAVADPGTISPNADGAADVTTVTYRTTAGATVDVVLLDAAGALVTQLLEPKQMPAGEHALTFDGIGLPDSVYTLVVSAVGADGTLATAPVTLRITRTLGRATVAPALFSPTAAGGVLTVVFRLAAPATVRVSILRDGKWIATPFSGALEPGRQRVTWDGTKRAGHPLDGQYTAVVQATDAVGSAAISLSFVKDELAPRVRLVEGRWPRLWVSEAASVTVRVNGAAWRVVLTAPGPIALPGISKIRKLLVVARDAAGNSSVVRRS